MSQKAQKKLAPLLASWQTRRQTWRTKKQSKRPPDRPTDRPPARPRRFSSSANCSAAERWAKLSSVQVRPLSQITLGMCGSKMGTSGTLVSGNKD